MKRTIIIGSGITGMAAALLLAKQESNNEILILEAAKSPAPLLSGFKRKGLHFDTGFHCAGGLRQGGILRHWLRHLGVWDYIGDENIYPLTEEFRFGSNNTLYNFPSIQSELAASITSQFDANTAQAFLGLFDEVTKVLNISPYTNPLCLDLPKLSWENSQTLPHKLEQFPLPKPLQQMLKARCLLYGLKPEDATFHDYSLVGGLYFDSCHGIYGGGKTLVKALLKALTNNSINVRCRAKVAKILHESKKVVGIQLDNGELIKATRCIFTGHPSQLPKMIDKGVFRPAFFQHINSMPETAYALMLFGESKNPYLSERAIYALPEDLDASVLTPMGQRHPTLYAVGGKQDIHGQGFPLVAILPMENNNFKNLDKPRPKSYTDWKIKISSQAQKYLQERVPELGPVTIHDVATHATMQDWIYGSTGSLYGIAHTASSMPLLPITRMEGFFLAGQNILLPGLLGGIVSAAVAIGFATDHNEVLKGFRTCAKNELS